MLIEYIASQLSVLLYFPGKSKFFSLFFSMDLIITVSSLSPEKLTLSLENASLQEHSRQSSPISTCIAHQFSSCLISHRRRYTLGFSQRQSFHFGCGPASPLLFTRMLLLFFPPFSLASSICLPLLDHYW